MTQRLCSMTGFAREAGFLGDGTAFAWEMKSVNGRGLELRFRLPPGLDALEGPAREAAAKRFKRGNVQIGLTLKQEGRAPLSPDMAALDRMVELAQGLAARLGTETPRAEALLALPGIFRAEQTELSEAEEEARRSALLAAFQRALAALWESRAAEGARLAGILTALLDEIEALCAAAAQATEISIAALKAGRKLLFCGNGGSAADAQHWAGELVSRFHYDRPGLPAIALTTDSSILTAIGNDYGYERVFARQVEALGVAGDVLVAISTSGNSPNVVAAIEAARAQGLATIGFTGQGGGLMATLCDVCIRIPSTSTPRIQEGHEVLGHALCALIEATLFPRPAG